MAFPLRSQTDILIGITNELRNAGINYLPKGSKAYALAASLSKEFDVAYRFFDSSFDSAFLAGASGELLESLGVLFGVRRKLARKAISSIYEKSITFYVTGGGTFGSINNNGDITIPAGTIIQTPETSSSTASIQYQLLADVVCGASETVAFGTAEALIEGSSQNVGRHSLVVHNFNNYIDAANESLQVINRYGIVSGTDRESDASYRSRVSIGATALQAGNLTALRFALLSVPGVVDIRLLRYFDGIGTVGAFITGQDNEITPSLLAAGQAAIDEFSSLGEVVTVYAPNRVGIDFTTHVNLARAITQTEQNAIERQLLNITNDFFTALSIGDAIDIENLVTVLQRTSPLIVNFGTDPNKTQLDDVGLYRYSSASGERVRRTVLTDAIDEINIEQHEIFIPELSSIRPFTFTFDPIV